MELDSDASVSKFLKDEPASVDLVLVCHSVEVSSRMFLCAAIRKHYPATPILMLYSTYEFVPPQVTASLASLGNPKDLLARVQFLLGT